MFEQKSSEHKNMVYKHLLRHQPMSPAAESATWVTLLLVPGLLLVGPVHLSEKCPFQHIYIICKMMVRIVSRLCVDCKCLTVHCHAMLGRVSAGFPDMYTEELIWLTALANSC